jgi:hypothetical protein
MIGSGAGESASIHVIFTGDGEASHRRGVPNVAHSAKPDKRERAERNRRAAKLSVANHPDPLRKRS